MATGLCDRPWCRILGRVCDDPIMGPSSVGTGSVSTQTGGASTYRAGLLFALESAVFHHQVRVAGAAFWHRDETRPQGGLPRDPVHAFETRGSQDFFRRRL